jgi:hypothetical protein
MGKLVRRFPALASLELPSVHGASAALTDKGLRAVSSLPALTLNLAYSYKVTDEGYKRLSNLPALTSLNLCQCYNVTAAGVQALRSSTTASNLRTR